MRKAYEMTYIRLVDFFKVITIKTILRVNDFAAYYEESVVFLKYDRSIKSDSLIIISQI